MTSKLGRNDPCWCGSGKKLKKCHGNQPVDTAHPPLLVAPAHTPTPITTHQISDGQRWVEKPGALSLVLGIQPIGSVDDELLELRRSWGTVLERNDLDDLTKHLNDIEHKLRGVRYHRDNLDRVENLAVERFRSKHTPPAGTALEERAPEILFEVEGFLYQVKSSMDMLARLLTAAGLRSIGNSFGDHGDRVLKQLHSVPNSCLAEAKELRNLIESAQPIWIDQVVSFRDQIAHAGMLDEFRCFVQAPVIDPSNVAVHYPTMPGGERASAYVARVERELRSFVNALVTVAIQIVIILRKERTRLDARGDTEVAP